MQVFLNNKKILLTTLISSSVLSGCYWDDPRTAAQYVSSNISKDNVVNHLVDLEARASTTTDGSSITRAAGTSGYEQSKDYIVRVMKKMAIESQRKNSIFVHGRSYPAPACKSMVTT